MSTFTYADVLATAQQSIADGTDVVAFRTALSDASIAGDADSVASDTLKSIALTRYVMHAANPRYSTGGVVHESARRDVSALLWLEASQSVSAPAAKDRTPGETTLGQYVARFGTVATDADYGLAWLGSVETVNAAYKSISEARRAAKEAEAERDALIAAAADREAFSAWLSAQPAAVRHAFGTVDAALHGDALPHLAAAVALFADPRGE